VKAYSVVRLYGRGVIVACLIIAFLLVSVELPRASADPTFPANDQDMVEVATFILREISDINLSKYPFEIKFTPVGTYMGLPERSVIFSFKSGGDFVEFMFTFTNGSFRLLDAYATGEFLHLLPSGNELDVAKSFLERCRDRIGAVHYKPMISLLEGVRAGENVTTCSGNIKFTARCGRVRGSWLSLCRFS